LQRQPHPSSFISTKKGAPLMKPKLLEKLTYFLRSSEIILLESLRSLSKKIQQRNKIPERNSDLSFP
jgi:hypothetical protein